MSQSVETGIDWFELGCEITFEDAKFFLPDIIAKAKENRRFVRLGSGAVGILPEQWLKQYQRLKDFSTKEKDGKLLFGKSQGIILDALLQDQKVEADKSYSAMIKSLKKHTNIGEISPSKKFQGELRPYKNGSFMVEISPKRLLGGDALPMTWASARPSKSWPSYKKGSTSGTSNWEPRASSFPRVSYPTGIQRRISYPRSEGPYPCRLRQRSRRGYF